VEGEVTYRVVSVCVGAMVRLCVCRGDGASLCVCRGDGVSVLSLSLSVCVVMRVRVCV